MSEEHFIAGPGRGEPMPAGRVGARVRVPLSGTPGADWSRALAGHLAAGLTGHSAVGHLRMGGLVQGGELVLEGVERAPAADLGRVIEQAVADTNAGMARMRVEPAPCNMAQEEADAIAAALRLGDDAPDEEPDDLPPALTAVDCAAPLPA